MKKIFLILAALFILTFSCCKAKIPLYSVPSNSEDKEKKRYDKIIYYDPNDFVIKGTVLIKYRGNSANIIIPDGFTEIGENAFEKKQITSVIIPNTVTSIGKDAFALNGITNITIPNSVTFIGEYVFDINQLTKIIIPNSVTFIGRGAFWSNQIYEITIGENVSTTCEWR